MDGHVHGRMVTDTFYFFVWTNALFRSDKPSFRHRLLNVFQPRQLIIYVDIWKRRPIFPPISSHAVHGVEIPFHAPCVPSSIYVFLSLFHPLFLSLSRSRTPPTPHPPIRGSLFPSMSSAEGYFHISSCFHLSKSARRIVHGHSRGNRLGGRGGSSGGEGGREGGLGFPC